MPFKFRYWAKDNKGASSEGEIEASDIDSAKKKLAEQGLQVEGIHVVLGGGTSQTSGKTPAQKFAAPAPDQAAPSAQPADPSLPQTPKVKNAKMPIFIGVGASALIVLLIIPFLPHPGSNTAGANRKVEYKVMKSDDYSEGDTLRKDITVVIAENAGEDGVKNAAKEILASDQDLNKSSSQAMFHFFFPTQDYNTNKPVAVLRWNWDKSGKWEYSFSFERGNQKECINIEQTRLVSGEYVQYKYIMSDSISLDGAEKFGHTELERLDSQWRGKVKRIKGNFIYENFFDPFMVCEKDLTNDNPVLNIKCDMLKQ